MIKSVDITKEEGIYNGEKTVSGSFQMSQLFTSGGQNMSTNTEHFFSRDFFFLCRYLLSNIYLVM
jgi:hypothetical protein